MPTREDWETKVWTEALDRGLEVRFGRHGFADLYKDGVLVGVRWYDSNRNGGGNKMEDRSKRFTWEEDDLKKIDKSDVVPFDQNPREGVVGNVHERRVGGVDFEIELFEDGLGWRWEARKVGENEPWASGILEVNFRTEEAAVTYITWELFEMVLAEREAS